MITKKDTVTPRFDPVIHEPTRLRICGMLSPVKEMCFADIRDALGLSDSMCSRHLNALAESSYIDVYKLPGDTNRHRVTWAALTPQGRQALEAHLAALQAIANGTML